MATEALAPGRARVYVVAAAVNPADLLPPLGMRPALLARGGVTVPGMNVVAVGDGVTWLTPGDG